MPIVTAETLGNGNLTGVDHGATVSLIFDHGDPGGGPTTSPPPVRRDLDRPGRAT